MPGKILIVDDEKDMLALLKRILSEETEHQVVTEADPTRALELFKEKGFDLVITDLKMPKMDGIKLLESIKKVNPDVSVVILTAFATIETAVEAIRKGAYDYITKPFRRERILLTVEKVMKWQEMVRENQSLRQALAEKGDFSFLVGSTSVMKELLERVKQVAPTVATVLITGASGTGKELVARAIHQHSLRASKKFITVNCTAIPEQVIESELFGHLKGSFTGAWKDKRGLVEEANEGTLFLDEIGDLPMPLQAKLLRFLQERVIERLGGRGEIPVDVRVVCATHRDLAGMIREGSFREDLYYRLSEITVKIPPLRERPGDAVLLAQAFLERYAREMGRPLRGFTADALAALEAHAWPGNVREMENLIKRATIMADGNQITAADLGLDSGTAEPQPFNLRQAREHAERLAVSRALAHSDGNIAQAAELLGVTRPTLYDLMAKIGMK